MRHGWWVLGLLVLAGGCREDDGPFGGDGAGRLVVDSDPRGGRITIDGRATGRFTPDTVPNMGGLHEVTVELDTLGLTYRYAAEVVVTGTDPVLLTGPLVARCQQQVDVCARPYHDEHVVGNVRFGTNALGPLFLENGQGGGLYWPAQSSNSYASTGTPVFAARWDGVPVSTGVYDTEFLAGRPAPRLESLGGGAVAIRQTSWILPPVTALPLTVARGMQIEQQVVASPAQEGVFLVQLTYRNITNTTLYRIMDPDAEVRQTGVTFTDAYIGLALDPDIGTASDDWYSYDPVLDAVFAYDAAFAEGGFTTSQASPALLGMRVLRAPAGARVVLNGWVNPPQGSADWHAGTNSQVNGYGMLSGEQSYVPDHAGQQLGHLAPDQGDARITATVGPLRLAPGETATVVLAIALAAPVAGTYTSGQVVQPGDPTDTARPLYRIAATLRSRLTAAEELLTLLR